MFVIAKIRNRLTGFRENLHVYVNFLLKKCKARSLCHNQLISVVPNTANECS